MASGTPSSARQMAATAIAFRSVIAKPGRAAAARSANSCTASKPASSVASRGASEGGTSSGATWRTDSCGMRSGSWLVATIRSSGQAARSRWQRAAQAFNQMLAVVEHDQCLPRLQRVGQRVRQRPPGLSVDADQGGHPGDDQVRLPQVTQLDHVDAVREVAGRGGHQPQGQPGLPDAARAAQGEGPGPVQRLAQIAEFAFPPDEPVWFLRQLGRTSLWFHFPY